MLRLDGVSKRYGSHRAVDGVSLTVRRGTITALIGPNGAGKTTLFNAIAGAVPIDSGSITLNGTRIDGLPPHRIFAQGLVRTFQLPRPFPGMSVLENTMLVPSSQVGESVWNNWFRPAAVATEEARTRARAEEILAFCNLSAVTRQQAGAISGGQQKLLALAQALMAEPALILLDEPAAGVNPALMEVLVEKIEEINRRGITFLIIEHNMDLVMRICDPIMVMAQGKILAEGNADSILADANVVEAYLGGSPA